MRSPLLNSSASETLIWKSSPGCSIRLAKPAALASSPSIFFSRSAGFKSLPSVAGSVVAIRSDAASCIGPSGRTAARANRRRTAGASPWSHRLLRAYVWLRTRPRVSRLRS